RARASRVGPGEHPRQLDERADQPLQEASREALTRGGGCSHGRTTRCAGLAGLFSLPRFDQGRRGVGRPFANSHLVGTASVHPRVHDPALRLVIAYKLVKGAAWLVGAAVITFVFVRGGDARVTELGESLRHHLTGAWSNEAAHKIIEFSGSGKLWLVPT